MTSVASSDSSRAARSPRIQCTFPLPGRPEVARPQYRERVIGNACCRCCCFCRGPAVRVERGVDRRFGAGGFCGSGAAVPGCGGGAVCRAGVVVPGVGRAGEPVGAPAAGSGGGVGGAGGGADGALGGPGGVAAGGAEGRGVLPAPAQWLSAGADAVDRGRDLRAGAAGRPGDAWPWPACCSGGAAGGRGRGTGRVPGR